MAKCSAQLMQVSSSPIVSQRTESLEIETDWVASPTY